MTTPRKTIPLAAALAVAGLAATSVPASADSLVAPAPGAVNLTQGGGYLAWAAPTPAGRFRLVVRAPDGTVSTPDLPDFGAAPDPTIGSDRFAAQDRALLLAYSRCDGDSAIAGCDVYAYDLRSGGAERRIDRLASRTYSETVPALTSGRWSFVRRGGGTRKGVYAWTGEGAPRRLSPRLARETVNNGSRTSFVYNSSRGFGVAVKRLSGRGETIAVASRLRTQPFSLSATRYRTAWLATEEGGGVRAFTTSRFAGSGPEAPLSQERANRLLPAGTNSWANDGSFFTRYLDGAGVKTIDPRLFRAG